MRRIAVIGGGASGIAAAIQAAGSGAQVTMFEVGTRIGHSILVSGNGRCNFSNARVAPEVYRNEGFVADAFGACPPYRVWDWFRELGLLSTEEAEGRLYPQANKASSVLDVLRFALDERGVRVECEREVSRIAPEDGQWVVEYAQGGWSRFDAVVMSCGGSMGKAILPPNYRLEPTTPVLCPLRTNRNAVRGLDNVRAKASIALFSAHQGMRDSRAFIPAAVERGEVQFRTYGISGIAVFNLSRVASGGDTVEIDLLPDYAADELVGEISRRVELHPGRTIEQLLAGIALPAVIRVVVRQAGFSAADEATALAGSEEEVAAAFKRFTLAVEGFEAQNAQVRRGGVAVDQVDPTTMESHLDAGLFVTGEALDVDGPCGGYNLHWAWTSGILAGEAAAVASERATGDSEPGPGPADLGRGAVRCPRTQ